MMDPRANPTPGPIVGSLGPSQFTPTEPNPREILLRTAEELGARANALHWLALRLPEDTAEYPPGVMNLLVNASFYLSR